MIIEANLETRPTLSLEDDVRVVTTIGESRKATISTFAKTVIDNYAGIEVGGVKKTIPATLAEMREKDSQTESQLSALSVHVSEIDTEITSIDTEIESITNDIASINQQLGSLLDFFYPVGTHYYTSDNDFNPNNAWGGIWEKLSEGSVLMSAGEEFLTGNHYGENEKYIERNHIYHTHNYSGGDARTAYGGAHSHDTSYTNRTFLLTTRSSGTAPTKDYLPGDSSASGKFINVNGYQAYSATKTGISSTHLHLLPTIEPYGDESEKFNVMQSSVAVNIWKRLW